MSRPIDRSVQSARRRFVQTLVGAAWLAGALQPRRAAAGEPVAVGLSVPGPGNSVSAPFELAAELGLDRAAGIALRLKFVAGGGVALKDLGSRNVDFAAFGLPAAMLANALGADVVALAAMDDLPLYTLMVRADLRREVRQVADLRGRIVGVHSNSLANKTTSSQMAELVLRRHGVAPDAVRFVAAGQSWDTQSSMMLSRSVDASMCDEPFGIRMEAQGLAYPLFCTGRPQDIAAIPGAGFLRATLIARRDRVAADPALAACVVDMALRTLRWIADHSAVEMADALKLAAGPERDAFLLTHARYPRMFSRDGKFSQAQLSETEVFV
ncbi:MAG TPA: ABC transporter substrate-binding protein, partial [Albitalea sp.]|nr:ABC transporter substrate-binding protein [Albitalea sp.]